MQACHGPRAGRLLLAFCGSGDECPLGPGLQALLVHRGDPLGGLFAEEHAQRRLLGVDDLEDCATDPLGAGRLGGGTHLGQRRVQGPVGVLTMRGEDRRAREVGCEGAGFNHRDLDAERRDFLGEGLAHPFQRPLGGAVATGAAEGGNPHGRGDLNDVAATLLPQDGQYRLDDMEDAEDVGLQLVAQFLLAEILHGADQGVTGVVDHHVQPAEPLSGRRDRFEHLGAVGGVQLQRQYRVTEPLDQVGQPPGVAGGGRDLVAALQGSLCELTAEAARGTRDEPDFFRHMITFSM